MKNLIKIMIFIAFEILLINKFFRYLNKGKIKVLLYHNIVINSRQTLFNNAISKKIFIKQLKYLKKHYNIVSLSQNGEWNGLSDEKVNILLTFDDGFINNYEIVFPILLEFKISAYFFIISDYVETGDIPLFMHKRYLNSDKLSEFKTININQMREMLKKGMNIGSHSLFHNEFSKMSVSDSVQNAKQSKQYLEKMLGTSVECFAFPWGFYREEQIEPIKKIFSRIFTVKHGFNLKQDQILNRNEVDGFFHMCITASGALDWFKK
jgi:peptidoglycan/xylan/chitin deacetylase (PgdA/CDA1 family)